MRGCCAVRDGVQPSTYSSHVKEDMTLENDLEKGNKSGSPWQASGESHDNKSVARCGLKGKDQQRFAVTLGFTSILQQERHKGEEVPPFTEPYSVGDHKSTGCGPEAILQTSRY